MGEEALLIISAVPSSFSGRKRDFCSTWDDRDNVPYTHSFSIQKPALPHRPDLRIYIYSNYMGEFKFATFLFGREGRKRTHGYIYAFSAILGGNMETGMCQFFGRHLVRSINPTT